MLWIFLKNKLQEGWVQVSWESEVVEKKRLGMSAYMTKTTKQKNLLSYFQINRLDCLSPQIQSYIYFNTCWNENKFVGFYL